MCFIGFALMVIVLWMHLIAKCEEMGGELFTGVCEVALWVFFLIENSEECFSCFTSYDE